MSFILVDVEATSLTPWSGAMTEFGAVELKSRASYHGVLYDAIPDPENPAKPMLVDARGKPVSHHDHVLGYDEVKVMQGFADWLNNICGKSRPIFVSDNPAYDFMWVAYSFDRALGRNPFGHSGRRISDFWAGLQGDFSNTQKWKRYRLTSHDHNPVNDAMGNAEALQTILDQAKGEA